MNETKIGVALTKCYFCNEDDQILLNTRLTTFAANQVEAAHGKVINMEPCQKCQGYMKQGIIMITIDSSKSDSNWNKVPIPNPYRTGGWFVVTEAAIKRWVSDDSLVKWALKRRFMFIEHEAAEKIGLFTAQT